MDKGLTALLSGALALMPPQSVDYLIMLSNSSPVQQTPAPVTKRDVDSKMREFVTSIFREQDEGRSYSDQLKIDDDTKRLITVFQDRFNESGACFATKIRINSDGSIDYEVIANHLLLYGSMYRGLTGIKVYTKSCSFDFQNQAGEIQDIYFGFSPSHPLLPDLQQVLEVVKMAWEVFHWKKIGTDAFQNIHLPNYFKSEQALFNRINPS